MAQWRFAAIAAGTALLAVGYLLQECHSGVQSIQSMLARNVLDKKPQAEHVVCPACPKPQCKSEAPKALENTQPQNSEEMRRMADGCYHVFIDAGSNRGIHSRFLFEPELYPKNPVAALFYDPLFGKDRKRMPICAFGFEPNPYHEKAQKAQETAYNSMGWRYKFMPFGVSDANGALNFYKNQAKTNGDKNEFWGFSTTNHEPGNPANVPVERRVIDFALWFEEHVLKRKLPEAYTSSMPPRILLKMDIEGHELRVLTKMMLTGQACKLDGAFLEFHQYGITMNDGDFYRGDQQKRLFESLNMVMKAGGCKTNFTVYDTEAYLHDGQPLPKANPSSPPHAWALSSKFASDFASPSLVSRSPLSKSAPATQKSVSKGPEAATVDAWIQCLRRPDIAVTGRLRYCPWMPLVSLSQTP